MSNRVLLPFVVPTLSSGIGYLFTVCSACVPELIAATTNGKALGHGAVQAVLNGTVHGGLISHKSEGGDGVARPARNSREGGVPGVAEGGEAESSPRDRQGHAVPLARSRSVARQSSRLNDDGMVGMRPTSSIRESAEGETFPRSGGGGDHPLNIIGDSWPAHPPADGGVVSASFLLAFDALHLAMHIPNNESFNYIPMLLPASGMFAAAAAGKPRHSHVADTVLIPLMIMMTPQFPRRDREKKKTRRGRTRAAAAVTATALLVLVAASALPNGAAAARPLRGGGHAQAAAPPPPPPRVMPKSLASSGRSSCTNDPNTMGVSRPCVHP